MSTMKMINVRDEMRDKASHHVVVWDPKNEYWPGGIVPAGSVAPLHARGVATLPVEPELMKRNALGGYFLRSWGAGWPLSAGVPRFHCPMALWIVLGYESVNWVARLVPDREKAIDGPSGMLRLTVDSGQDIGTFAGAFEPRQGSAINLQELGEADDDGGWTLYGRDGCRAARANLFACGLYGAAAGLRVAWAAVTQTG